MPDAGRFRSSLRFADVAAPAIELAEMGFPVYDELAETIEGLRDLFGNATQAARRFICLVVNCRSLGVFWLIWIGRIHCGVFAGLKPHLEVGSRVSRRLETFFIKGRLRADCGLHQQLSGTR